MTTPSPDAGRQAAGHAGAALLSAAAAFALTLPAWLDPTRRVVGNPGDPEEYLFFVKWFQYALWHHHNPLFSTWVNYPAGINLMWNTADPALGLAAAPVTAVAGPLFSYNLLITLAIATSAWAAYLLCRRYVARWSAAVVGGLVFGLSPYVLQQKDQHLSIAFVAFVPLLWLLLDEILIRRRWPWPVAGAALGVLNAIQLLISEEILAMAAIMSVIGLVAAALVIRRFELDRLASAGAAALLSLLVFAVLAAYPIWFQFRGPRRPNGLFHPHNEFVTDALNLLYPTYVQAWYGDAARTALAHATGNGYEFTGYLGIPVMLLIGVAAIAYRRTAVVPVAALVTLAAFVLSLGPHLHVGGVDTHLRLPWLVIDRLPVLNNALPARLTLFGDAGVAVAIAVFLDRIVAERALARAGGLVLAGAALVSLLPSWPAATFTPPVPAYFRGGGVRDLPEGSVALVVPFADQAFPEPGVWQSEADMRFRMPEGYFIGATDTGEPTVGAEPSGLSEQLVRIQEQGTRGELGAADRAALQRDLEARRVDTVILGPMPHQDLALEFLTWLLGTTPAERDGVYVWRDVRASRSPA